MFNDKKKRFAVAGALLFCGIPGAAIAEGEDEPADSPLTQGAYIAPMASFIITDGPKTSNGYGGILAGGYRNGGYAFEFKGIYDTISSKESSSVKQWGGSVGYLLFPFELLPNLYGIAEVGGLSVLNYPARDRAHPALTQKNITTVNGGLGAGYLLAMSVGQYEYALRTEALYRYGHRDTDVTPGGDIIVPKTFNDVLINVGLQLPLTKKAPPPPPPEPVKVVPAPVDTDGDGVPDERDQCPDTPVGTQVNDVGCPLPPPCTSPADGERFSLKGCKTGDTIVLRGVNFEFDNSRLTANAATILDVVADELSTHPEVLVELGGHTDSLGSDAYNQRLSDQRAAAVRAYLEDKGIATDRMSSVGFGELQPVDTNETEEGRERNRRVELKITRGGAEAAPASGIEAATEPAALPDADAPVSPVDAAPTAEAGPSAEELSPAP